jgi:salicylate hydroxylase
MPSTAETRKTPHVLIAGAGIGGLAAAASLLARGIDCDVYEQAPELKEIGAGLWLSVNGAKVLFALGLEPGIRASVLEADERAVRLWDSGRKWTLFKRGVSPAAHAPFVMLRAQLHAVLIDAVNKLKPGIIQLNKRVTGYTEQGGKVTLQFADGTNAQGDVLVGADGLHSKIREKTLGETPGRFTNALAWRGLVPMERLKPHHREALTATTWVGPTAHVTVYPARWQATDLMTFSGQVERSDWRLESWSEKGTVAECVNDFKGWHPDVVEIIENTESLHKWGLFVRDPLPQWSKGRVTLLGDACHSMVPYLGQGVNMAIEDAGVLARCLEKYPDPVVALAKYQDARLERTTKVAARSADMQHTFHNPALAQPDTAAAYADAQWNPAAAKARYDWIYEYDATQVPI